MTEDTAKISEFRWAPNIFLVRSSKYGVTKMRTNMELGKIIRIEVSSGITHVGC